MVNTGSKKLGKKVPFSLEEKGAVLDAIEGWVDLLNDAHTNNEEDTRQKELLIIAYDKILYNTMVLVKPPSKEKIIEPEIDPFINDPDILEIH